MIDKQERKPNPIIRREKFVVDHSTKNQYGDLIVTSKAGNEYKVGNKREQLFPTFQPDTEVVVGYASYMNREYIAEATPSTQLVSADTAIQEEKPKAEAPKPLPKHEAERPKETYQSGQTEGMWWKELGAMLRQGPPVGIDLTKPMGKALRTAYYAAMLNALPIQMERKETD